AWAIDERVYKLKASPFKQLKVGSLAGAAEARQRVLSDDELGALWQAADSLKYPLRQFVMMLILTGQRLQEVAGGRWSEIDLEKRRWVIPPERMKNDGGHVVPLSDPVVRMLKDMPRGRGPYVFSSGDGSKPIVGFGTFKARLDRKLDGMPDWRFHDV